MGWIPQHDRDHKFKIKKNDNFVLLFFSEKDVFCKIFICSVDLLDKCGSNLFKNEPHHRFIIDPGSFMWQNNWI